MLKIHAGEVLLRSGWLSQTPKDFSDQIIARSDLLEFRKGQSVYSAGDDSGGIFGLAVGSLEVHSMAPDGRPTLAHIGGPGFWIGDLAALTGRPRRLTMSASTDCRLLRLTRKALLGISEAEPANWRYFALLMASNLALAIDIADALRRSDPVGRVAATVLNLTSRDAGNQGPVTIAQSDIASIAGLSRSAVNAAIRKLQRRGFIRIAYASFEVLDREALEDFLRGL